jgi:hypothetical protein
MCCEHDHQIRLSPRPPRRRHAADTPIVTVGHAVIDHERRPHRLTAQLVRSRNRSMLSEEVATG